MEENVAFRLSHQAWVSWFNQVEHGVDLEASSWWPSLWASIRAAHVKSWLTLQISAKDQRKQESRASRKKTEEAWPSRMSVPRI